jgi:FixJ family two-component response regulator
MKSAAMVVVVDDDESVRESLPELLTEFGFPSKAFASAEEFLQSGAADEAKCLILDVAMPGMSGPELRRELLKRGYSIPTIFITADAGFAAQLDMREGVVDCLTKPFGDTALLGSLKRALNLK